MMNKKIVLLSISVLAIVLFALVGYNYVLHGGARNLSSEEAAFSITSKTIIDEFATDSESANKKYLDKAINISGKITSISENDVILDDVIVCSLTKNDATLKANQTVILKGRVVGYDDLMGELKMDQCLKSL